MARERAGEMLTVQDVLAELGGISRRTFYRWRELGLAPACIRLPNGELRVRRSVLNAWLDERAEGAWSGRGSICDSVPGGCCSCAGCVMISVPPSVAGAVRHVAD
jgi:predicted DNA-binding transcriptional regulator AlpA